MGEEDDITERLNKLLKKQEKLKKCVVNPKSVKKRKLETKLLKKSNSKVKNIREMKPTKKSKIKLLHNEGKKKSEKNIKSRLKYLFKKSTSAKKNIPTAKEKITNNKLIKKNKTKKIKKESIVSLKRKSGKDLLDRLTVAEVMKKAEVMDIDSLVVEVVREFSEKNCTGIFISKKEKIVGLIILPDILEILRKKKKIAKLKAGEIMGELICMNKKDSLSKAILGMHMHKSGCIAVKDHKKVIGVVTRSMILNKIAKNIFATENEGLVGNIIETKVDKLLDLLRKKETNMKELEEKLNLDNEKIEEWLEILKNHNLIKYKKSLFGKLLIENVK